MPALIEYGRAKINLTLRVVGRRVDGYHELESVVAFADCADGLRLAPGSKLSLKTIGPLAEACGDTSDNLVFKAARLTGADVPVCLNSRACVMTGVGETLLPLDLPKLPCVMVNPRIPVATKDVFGALALRNGELLVGASDVIRAA